MSSRRLAGGILVALAVVSIAVSSSVYAKTTGLSIGPFLQEVILSKGQASNSFILTISNSTNYPLPLIISVVDFGAADESGGINFLPTRDKLEHKYGLASWMHPEKDSLLLIPHSAQRVKVTVENRDSMSPGGHYGAVVFQLDRSRIVGDNNVKVDFAKAVSTLVLAKKSDGAKQSITYSGMTWDGSPLALPTEVHVKFFNGGNVHTTPTGDVTLRDTLGHIVSQDKLNGGNTIILPETQRTYPVMVSNHPISWIPGWATLTVRYRANETSPYKTESTRMFIVSPYTVLVLVAVIVATLLGFRFRKRIAKLIRYYAHHSKRPLKHVHKRLKQKRSHKTKS